MRTLFSICAAALFSCATAVAAEDAVYEGVWHTTNRKLDGTMACAVKDLGDGKWTGRFYGVWQGVPFDYTVAFSGRPKKLTGKATIDGADYTWTGDMNAEEAGRFKGNFEGNRYSGTFDLKRKQPAVTVGVQRAVVR